MKFLYCVRAASSPIAMSAVMYDLPPNRFQASAQLVCASDSTDQELDQSSDADSEMRSERAKRPEVNGSDAQTSHEEPINSTSDEPRYDFGISIEFLSLKIILINSFLF